MATITDRNYSDRRKTQVFDVSGLIRPTRDKKDACFGIRSKESRTCHAPGATNRR